MIVLVITLGPEDYYEDSLDSSMFNSEACSDEKSGSVPTFFLIVSYALSISF